MLIYTWIVILSIGSKENKYTCCDNNEREVKKFDRKVIQLQIIQDDAIDLLQR